MEAYHWTPRQIGELTFPQLSAMSGSSKEDEKGVSYAEVCRRVAEFRKRKEADEVSGSLR